MNNETINNDKCFLDCHQDIIDKGFCDCVKPKPIEGYNPFQEELNLTRKLFNLEELLNFQMKHDVQIIRGADWQYECYIDKACYNISLTPIGALVLAIHSYKLKKLDE